MVRNTTVRKNRPNKPGPSFDGHAGPDPRADDLSGAHAQSRRIQHIPPDDKQKKRQYVTGEIHDPGIPGRFGHIESHHHNKRGHPERTGSGAEKTVIKPEPQPEHQEKQKTGHLLPPVFIPDLRGKQHVHKDRQQQNRHKMPDKPGIQLLYGPCSAGRSCDGEQDACNRLFQINGSAPDVIVCRRERAETALQFIGAERHLRGESGREECRQSNQPPSSGH